MVEFEDWRVLLDEIADGNEKYSDYTLIRGSLDHWLENLCFSEEGLVSEIDTASESCVLCEVYIRGDCDECPLEEVGKCCFDSNSPYNAVLDELYSVGEYLRETVLDMVQVLEDLLDEYSTNSEEQV